MTCHFVYSVPNLRRGVLSKILFKLSHYGLPVSLMRNRQPNNNFLSSWPIRSPYENTKHIYQALVKVMPTKLYHLTERVRPKVQNGDVFLGHPFFPYIEGMEGVTEYFVRSKINLRKRAIISPLHCGNVYVRNHINKDYLRAIDKLVPRVDVIFGIMGEYWWEQWDNSEFSHWKKKMVRLDMAVDVSKYPRVKTSFNKPGKRGFLYIGANMPSKGTSFLSDLFGYLSDFRVAWIGNGSEIPGIPRLSTTRELTPEFMKDIADQFDFFISPSIADANPTTILESMSWGFPVICTPQSGYYEKSYMRNIEFGNIESSAEILSDFQYKPENLLLAMANEARCIVESKYNWQNFTDTIIYHLLHR